MGFPEGSRHFPTQLHPAPREARTLARVDLGRVVVRSFSDRAELEGILLAQQAFVQTLVKTRLRESTCPTPRSNSASGDMSCPGDGTTAPDQRWVDGLKGEGMGSEAGRCTPEPSPLGSKAVAHSKAAGSKGPLGLGRVVFVADWGSYVSAGNG